MTTKKLIKVLWDGSCKHYGFIGAPKWNESGNHYLGTVDGQAESGQYLNSQNRISRYTATRWTLGRFWFNVGQVTGYKDEAVWFWRFGYTGDEYEYAVLPNITNFTALTMKTKYRWVEEDRDNTEYSPVSWIKNKFR